MSRIDTHGLHTGTMRYVYVANLLLLIVGVLMALPLQAQTFERDTIHAGLGLTAELGGRVSSGSTAPFWMVHGQGGRRSLSPTTGEARLYATYCKSFGIHKLSAVVEGVVESGLNPIWRLRQVGVRYDLPFISLSLGALDAREPLDLSPQTSGKMMGSNNAAPIPMVLLQTNGFQSLPFTNGWVAGFLDFSLGRMVEEDYLQRNYPDAQRGDYTLGTLWHHKTLYLRLGKSTSEVPLRLTLGGMHAAMWGGKHYLSETANPHGFRDFLRVVMGKSGGEDATLSDKINVLGNQFGQYLMMLDYTNPKGGTFQIYHYHYFEDKSGVEWSNGPDGLFGLHWQAPTNAWGVKDVTLEYVTTLHQSGSMHILNIERPNGEGRGGGADSYYSNSEYRSGATYLGMNLGNPLLITKDYLLSPNYSPNIVHNRVTAWHFGLGGTIIPLSGTQYELKLTYETSYGSNYRLIDPSSNWYSYFRVSQPLPWLNGLSVGCELGADWGSITPNTYAVALSLRYHL